MNHSGKLRMHDDVRQSGEQNNPDGEENTALVPVKAGTAASIHMKFLVSRGASEDEVRSAYVELMAKYHLDNVAHLGNEFQNHRKGKVAGNQPSL